VFGALFALFSLVCWIKATTERTTQAWLDHGKRRRLGRQSRAANAALAETAAQG
jgi:hypothetical protein